MLRRPPTLTVLPSILGPSQANASPSTPELLRRRSHSFVFLLAALAGYLGACSGDSGAPSGAAATERAPRYRTLEWKDAAASTESESRAPVVVATLTPDGEGKPWRGMAPGGAKEVDLPPEVAGDPTVRAMALLGLGKGKRLEVDLGHVDEEFNEVLIELQIFSRKLESVELSLEEGGKTVAQTPMVRLERRNGWQTISVSVPSTEGLTRLPETLVLDFAANRQKTVAVTRITLIRRNVLGFLPPLDAPATRLSRDHYRTAGALKPGTVAELVLEAGELEPIPGTSLRLEVALGQIPGMAKEGDRLAVELQVLSGSAEEPGKILETFRKDLGVSGGPGLELGWQDCFFDLPEGKNGLTVRLRLSEESSGLALVTPPILAHRKDEEATETAPAETPKTVVLITSDTHRADHMGLADLDEPLVNTPTLDALGREGVVFRNCYSSTNVTTPSHAALLTGRHPRDIRILSNRVRLSDQAVTLAEHFQDAGYATFAVISIPHLLDPTSGLGQGFHRMDGPTNNARDAEISVARARQWLAEAADVPVFLWLHLFDAHDPYGPPKPFRGKYYPKDQDPRDPKREWSLPDRVTPGWIGEVTDPDFFYAEYRAEIDYLDQELAALLDDSRVREGIVAFTADHGENFGDHNIWFSHGGLFPSTLHVPLLLRWPGGPSGAESSAPVRQMDLGRTLLDLAGLENAAYPGRNLRWGLDEPTLANPRFFISSEALEAAIEADGWLLNLSLVDHYLTRSSIHRPLGRVELFHLAADSKGEMDVLDENIPRAKKLRARLIQWLKTAPAQGLASEAESSAEMEALLTELGYAQAEEEVSSELWRPEKLDDEWATNPWRLKFED